MRWSWLLGCGAAEAVAASLLEMQGCVGTDGASPGMRWKGTSVMPALPRRQSVAHVFQTVSESCITFGSNVESLQTSKDNRWCEQS